MLLTIGTTREPATDLGYLLHKNPGRAHEIELTFGRAWVVYPEASPARCVAALALDVDPIALARDRRRPPGEGFALAQYVNDRPYVASSFMSVALRRAFGTAMTGRSKERPELAERAIPLRARIESLPCRGGDGILRELFEPLGYEVRSEGRLLDDRFPEWGEAACRTVELGGTVRLRDLLTHLYVLMPVLDNAKHYWIGGDEVDKLLRNGGDWLARHPARELIASRYLRRRSRLVDEALARLIEVEGAAAPDSDADAAADAEAAAGEEERAERSIPAASPPLEGVAATSDPDAPPARSLNEERLDAVVAALRDLGASKVLDLGCGEGKLERRLAPELWIAKVLAVDVSPRALAIARERAFRPTAPEAVRARFEFVQGSLLYRDRRLEGYDAAAVVEVIEHLDQPRLRTFERAVFEFARPAGVVVTTPNAEYNALWPSLPAGKFRHPDHRFEWTRAEFRAWAEGVCDRRGYAVEFRGVGPEDAERGCPTQMAVFRRGAPRPAAAVAPDSGTRDEPPPEPIAGEGGGDR